MKSEYSPTYHLGFTAASLRPELCLTVARAYLEVADWKAAFVQVIRTNALQCGSASSLNRLEREIRPRLQRLTRDQLELLASSTLDVRTAIAWLASVKYSMFLYDFSAEVLRRKIANFDPVFRPSDYESFLHDKASDHPELLRVSESSQSKIRRVLLAMLREMRILTPGKPFESIQRPLLNEQLRQSIVADNPRWLAAFLVPDHEFRLQ